jgi:hypothetical protein
MITQWASSKAGLPPPGDPGTYFVFSSDVGKEGAKKFKRLASLSVAAECAAASAGSSLYEVVVDPDHPVHAFCDVDRPDTLFDTTVVVEQLLAAWNGFLADRCGFLLDAAPGVRCQVSTASTARKTSVHARFDADLPDMYAHRWLAEQLSDYVIEAVDTFPSLVYYKPKGDKTEATCVIDTAVYTAFRSFRALGMVKLGRDNPLVAFGGSSTDPLDHFIGRYDSSPPVPRINMPGAPLARAGRAPAVRLTAAGVTARTGAAAASRPAQDPHTLQQYSNIVNAWAATSEVFGGPIDVKSASAQLRGTVNLRLARGTICPYAKRAHSSNNIYLRLDEKRHFAVVVCFNKVCCALQEVSSIDVAGEELPALQTDIHDAVWCGTLHTQRENTNWTIRYDEPTMRPLPLAALVALGAGMGLGKTESLVKLFAAHARPGDKILLLSYSRALCAKYHADFTHYLPQLGFVNYQDSSGAMNDLCIVCCMDSLRRVETQNFRFLVVDEVASVLTHFNSPLMKATNEIVSQFELLVLQAHHVYFMDAVIDSTPIRNLVDVFERNKREVATWIWNSHVRPTNRVAEILTCSAGSAVVNKQTVLHAVLECIRSKVLAGEKVVVPTSTKSFAKLLDVFVQANLPGIRYKIYHGDNEGVKLKSIKEEWCRLDLLAYSPSISAGVSFAESHFTSLVAYLVVSSHTPAVDTALQQLFRVRVLASGDMKIYVHDDRGATRLPCTAGEVGKLLTTDLSLLRKYGTTLPISYDVPTRISRGLVTYDPDSLSYHIILGIILSHNRSVMRYVPLLVETLGTDYAIPVTEREIPALSKDAFDFDLAELVSAAKADGTVVWEGIQLLTTEEADALMEEEPSDVTPAERASLALYSKRVLWGIDVERVDEAFYNEYVIDEKDKQFYQKVKRFKHMGRYSFEVNQGRVTVILDGILGGVEPNMALYKSGAKDHYGKLLVGHELFEAIFAPQDLLLLQDLKQVTVHEDHVVHVLGAWLDKCSADEKRTLKSRLGSKTRSRLQASYTTFKLVCDKAFGIKLARGDDQHKDRAGYKLLTVQSKELFQFTAMYAPKLPLV